MLIETWPISGNGIKMYTPKAKMKKNNIGVGFELQSVQNLMFLSSIMSVFVIDAEVIPRKDEKSFCLPGRIVNHRLVIFDFPLTTQLCYNVKCLEIDVWKTVVILDPRHQG